MRAADQYMLDGLKQLCEETISQGLTVDNLADTYDIAERFNGAQLGRRCALYALEHYVVCFLTSTLHSCYSVCCCLM